MDVSLRSSQSGSHIQLPYLDKSQKAHKQSLSAIKDSALKHKFADHPPFEDAFKNRFFEDLTQTHKDPLTALHDLCTQIDLINPLLSQLKETYQEVEKLPLPDTYHQYFQDLFASNRYGSSQPDLLSFLLTLKDIKKVNKCFFDCIAPALPSDKETLALLYSWCSREKIAELDDLIQLTEKVHHWLEKKLVWEEDPNSPHPVSEIPACEIHLGLSRANEIMLNGKLIKINSPGDFFKTLYKEIDNSSALDLEKQSALFNKLSTIGWEWIYHQLKSGQPNWRLIKEKLDLPEDLWKEFAFLLKEIPLSSPKNLETSVINTFLPICIPLRLVSEGCWGYAHHLITNNFNASLRPKSMEIFLLSITSFYNYELTQVKSYGFQEKILLTFSWRIYPEFKFSRPYWKGQLTLKSLTFADGLTYQQKKEVLDQLFAHIPPPPPPPERKKGIKQTLSSLFSKK